VETCAAVLTYPLLGVPNFNPSDAATLQAKKDMFAALRRFDEHLLDHMYLVFDKISVADVAAAAACINVYKLILTAEDREGLKNVTRWFYTVGAVSIPDFGRYYYYFRPLALIFGFYICYFWLLEKKYNNYIWKCVNQPQFKDIVGAVSESPVTSSAGSGAGESKFSSGVSFVIDFVSIPDFE
jgi:hypothetical protein